VTHKQKGLLAVALLFIAIWAVGGLAAAVAGVPPPTSMWLGLLGIAGCSFLLVQVRTVQWSQRRRNAVAGTFMLIALTGQIVEWRVWGLLEYVFSDEPPLRTVLKAGWLVALLAGFFIEASAPDTDLAQRGRA
jgi:Na+/proline symporter